MVLSRSEEVCGGSAVITHSMILVVEVVVMVVVGPTGGAVEEEEKIVVSPDGGGGVVVVVVVVVVGGACVVPPPVVAHGPTELAVTAHRVVELMGSPIHVYICVSGMSTYVVMLNLDHYYINYNQQQTIGATRWGGCN